MLCCYFVILLYNRTVDPVGLSVMDTATTAGVISGGVATSPLLVFIVPSILLFYCVCHKMFIVLSILLFYYYCRKMFIVSYILLFFCYILMFGVAWWSSLTAFLRRTFSLK